MRKSIFLNDVTCIDHGYLNDQGFIEGRSFLLDVIVTGDIPDSNAEQVVIDFSKCKKLIKQCIDDNETGFDHKCWVKDYQYEDLLDGYIEIKSNSTQAVVPKNAIKETNNFESDIKNQLESFLQSKYPDIDITIEIKLKDYIEESEYPRVYFNYSHGLKNSSSWGCQNLLHGHTSFIELYSDTHIDTRLLDDFDKVSLMFIYKDNIIFDKNGIMIISYVTERGTFHLNIDKNKYDSFGIYVIILDTETTIENLIDYVERIVKTSSTNWLKVSEGLQKGAVKFYK